MQKIRQGTSSRLPVLLVRVSVITPGNVKKFQIVGLCETDSRFQQQVELVSCEVGLCGSTSQTQEATVINQPLGMFFTAAPGCPKQMEAINHEINIKAFREENVMCIA